MDILGMNDADPGAHRFNPRTAAMALKTAMADLARQSGRRDADFDGMTMGDAYDLACESYGDDLPAYWKNWQTWNVASKLPPAAMGDL